MKKNKILLLILILGAFLRFYKLDWGNGFYFHPDEYHIVGAVERIQFPNQMNPSLFSYGSFIVYLIYFTRLVLKFFSINYSPFLIGRFYSALFSTATIGIIYLVSKKIFTNNKFPIVSAFLVAINPGLIQQAHYTTPESILTFWIVTTLYFWLQFADKKAYRFLILSSITLGLALATKIVVLVLFPYLFLIPMFVKLKNSAIISIKKLAYSSISSVIALVTFIAVFPYSILDYKSFINSMNYETAVGRGTQVVFYTRQFINTSPVLFQLTKILPYTLGPTLLIFSIMGLIIFVVQIAIKIKTRKVDQKHTIALLITFITLVNIFSFNAFLFAKWTRFIAPTFPLLCIFAVYAIASIKNERIVNTAATILIIPTAIWSYMFFSIYTQPDVRIKATNWIGNNISTSSTILTESGNTYEVPLSGNYNTLKFDFYNLENPQSENLLVSQIMSSDYFIVQSRRVYKNHMRLPSSYPITTNFYKNLFSGNLGFTLIKEIDSFPSFTLGNKRWFFANDESAEETWSVFDHPIIRIYKKTTELSYSSYYKLLETK